MPHMPDPISTDSNNDLENNTDNAHLDRCRHLPEISGKSLSADESDSNAMTDSGIILREKNLSGSDQEHDIIKIESGESIDINSFSQEQIPDNQEIDIKNDVFGQETNATITASEPHKLKSSHHHLDPDDHHISPISGPRPIKKVKIDPALIDKEQILAKLVYGHFSYHNFFDHNLKEWNSSTEFMTKYFHPGARFIGRQKTVPALDIVKKPDMLVQLKRRMDNIDLELTRSTSLLTSGSTLGDSHATEMARELGTLTRSERIARSLANQSISGSSRSLSSLRSGSVRNLAGVITNDDLIAARRRGRSQLSHLPTIRRSQGLRVANELRRASTASNITGRDRSGSRSNSRMIQSRTETISQLNQELAHLNSLLAETSNQVASVTANATSANSSSNSSNRLRTSARANNRSTSPLVRLSPTTVSNASGLSEVQIERIITRELQQLSNNLSSSSIDEVILALYVRTIDDLRGEYPIFRNLLTRDTLMAAYVLAANQEQPLLSGAAARVERQVRRQLVTIRDSLRGYYNRSLENSSESSNVSIPLLPTDIASPSSTIIRPLPNTTIRESARIATDRSDMTAERIENIFSANTATATDASSSSTTIPTIVIPTTTESSDSASGTATRPALSNSTTSRESAVDENFEELLATLRQEYSFLNGTWTDDELRILAREFISPTNTSTSGQRTNVGTSRTPNSDDPTITRLLLSRQLLNAQDKRIRESERQAQIQDQNRRAHYQEVNDYLAYTRQISARLNQSITDISVLNDEFRNIHNLINQADVLATKASSEVEALNNKENETICSHDVIVEIDTVSPHISECTGRIITLSNHSHGLAGQRKIITNFIGEILDNTGRYTFETRKWNSFTLGDKYYWSKFSSFKNSWRDSICDDRFLPDFDKEDCVFMRWKEIFHEDSEKREMADSDNGLASILRQTGSETRAERSVFLAPLSSSSEARPRVVIDRAATSRSQDRQLERNYSGYYYICFSRKTGSIKGFYCQNGGEKQGIRKTEENELNLEYLANANSYYQVDPVFTFMG